jgi:hypothetical protein
MVARTHEEAHEYQGFFEAGREVSLSRLYYYLPDTVEEPNLKQLVQLLEVNIKMNRESRPSRPSVPVTSSSIISSMASFAEETYPVCNNSSITSP